MLGSISQVFDIIVIISLMLIDFFSLSAAEQSSGNTVNDLKKSNEK